MWKRIDDILQPVLGKINLSFIKSYRTLVIIVVSGTVLAATLGGFFAFNYFDQKAKNLVLEEEERDKALRIKLDAINSEKNEEEKADENKAATSTTVSDAPVAKTATPKIPTTKTTPPPANSPSSTSTVYGTAAAQSYVEGVILGLVNAERRRVGVPALASNSTLARAADIRVGEEAIVSGSPDHLRPNGAAFSTVFSEVGYSGYTAWGENLVWGYQSQFTYNKANLDNIAARMFTNWKNSSGHYANMIKGTFNQTGIGVKLTNTNGRTYWWGIELFTTK